MPKCLHKACPEIRWDFGAGIDKGSSNSPFLPMFPNSIKSTIQTSEYRPRPLHNVAVPRLAWSVFAR